MLVHLNKTALLLRMVPWLNLSNGDTRKFIFMGGRAESLSLVDNFRTDASMKLIFGAMVSEPLSNRAHIVAGRPEKVKAVDFNHRLSIR